MCPPICPRARALEKEVKELEADNEKLAVDFDAVNQELRLLLHHPQQLKDLIETPEVARLLWHEANKKRMLHALREAA